MPPKTRMYVLGIPAHMVQRGHNRDACFYGDGDYRFVLEQIEAMTGMRIGVAACGRPVANRQA